jgi:hypothetical protein
MKLAIARLIAWDLPGRIHGEAVADHGGQAVADGLDIADDDGPRVDVCHYGLLI